MEIGCRIAETLEDTNRAVKHGEVDNREVQVELPKFGSWATGFLAEAFLQPNRPNLGNLVLTNVQK